MLSKWFHYRNWKYLKCIHLMNSFWGWRASELSSCGKHIYLSRMMSYGPGDGYMTRSSHYGKLELCIIDDIKFWRWHEGSIRGLTVFWGNECPLPPYSFLIVGKHLDWRCCEVDFSWDVNLWTKSHWNCLACMIHPREVSIMVKDSSILRQHFLFETSKGKWRDER